jgi:hypothetical protein
MSCKDCTCNKKKPTTPTQVNPWVQAFRSIPDSVWIIGVLALVALVALKILPPSDSAGGCSKTCTELELRVNALERHSARVDAQFHKSLK